MCCPWKLDLNACSCPLHLPVTHLSPRRLATHYWECRLLPFASWGAESLRFPGSEHPEMGRGLLPSTGTRAAAARPCVGYRVQIHLTARVSAAAEAAANLGKKPGTASIGSQILKHLSSTETSSKDGKTKQIMLYPKELLRRAGLALSSAQTSRPRLGWQALNSRRAAHSWRR